MEDKEIKDNDASERQMRLKALRNKQKSKPASSSNSNTLSSGGLKGRRDAGDDGGSDRKRQFIKKLLEKKMQGGQEGGDSGQKDNAQQRKLLLEGLKNKAGNDNKLSGKNLENFPRLKALLEKRNDQVPDDSAAHIEELESRITQLETALKKTQEQLESASKADNKTSDTGPLAKTEKIKAS